MIVKPREGLVVLQPNSSRALPADGIKVEPTPYWLRRLRDGDVVLIDAKESSGEPA